MFHVVVFHYRIFSSAKLYGKDENNDTKSSKKFSEYIKDITTEDNQIKVSLGFKSLNMNTVTSFS